MKTNISSIEAKVYGFLIHNRRILFIMAIVLIIAGYLTSNKDKYPKASKYAKPELVFGLILFGIFVGIFASARMVRSGSVN